MQEKAAVEAAAADISKKDCMMQFAQTVVASAKCLSNRQATDLCFVRAAIQDLTRNRQDNRKQSLYRLCFCIQNEKSIIFTTIRI